MFAPPVAKPKAVHPPCSKVMAHPPSQSAVSQAHMLQRSIGNQATLRLLAQRARDVHENDDNASTAIHAAAPSWDFSKIPVFSPNPTTHLPSPIQAKLKIGAVDDPLEHEADRLADQVMRTPDPEVSLAASPPLISRKCAGCAAEEKLQKRPAHPQPSAGEAPEIVHEVLRSPGQPLDPASLAYFEPRFGHDFSRVRVHTDQRATDAARDLAAHAFTIGEHIVFGRRQYAPDGATGAHLLAHELTHVVQQRAGGPALQRRADNCPDAPPEPPTIKTMADFIGLVERVEADAGTKSDPIATARLISRTKYDSRAWDWLLPSTKGKPGVVQTPLQEGEEAGKSWRKVGQVTADDIGSLCFKLTVSTPDGDIDPMHIIIGIVAGAETLPAGTGATGLSTLVRPLPASVSQLAASTWVGDVGKAAGDWMAIVPLPKGGGASKDDHWKDSAPDKDLLADIDGVAMTSKSPESGFALDRKASLSDNLRLYARSGRRARFHVFCSAEKFTIEKDGITLTAAANADIRQRIKDFAEWYTKNDPKVLAYISMASGSWHFSKALVERAGDWVWFADKFIAFVQKGLAAERAD
jgi:hypothetical protein